MPSNYWLCNICKSRYELMSQAEACEDLHPEKEGMKVVGASYKSQDGLTGPQKIEAATFPTKIILKITNHYGVYQLVGTQESDICVSKKGG